MDLQKGIALEYSGIAPRVVASARGVLAKKLIEIAEKNNITIYIDSDLAEILYPLKIGTEIPEELFNAIAKVFAFCYNVNSNFQQKINQNITR